MSIRNFLFLFVLFYTSIVRAQSLHEPQGPVRADSLYALDAGHLSFPPQSGIPLEREAMRWRISSTIANTSIVRDQYRVDAETRSLSASMTWGWRSDTNIEIEVPMRWRGGGVLDRAIDSWHKAFGLPHGRRDRVDDNEYDVSGNLNDSEDFEFADHGVVLGNTRLGLLHNLWRDSGNGVTLHAALSAPGQHSSQTHRGVDTLLGVSGWHSWEKLTGYSGVAIGALGDRDLYGVEYDPLFVEGFVALEYPLTDALRVSVALWSGSSKIENVQDHPSSFGILDVGLKTAGCGGVFELLVRENPWPQEGTPDIAFTLAWSSRA